MFRVSRHMIPFEDFQKLDIRIGTIVEAEALEGSTKLLKLVIDIGKEKRQLVAGIAKSYQPEEVIGKQIPVLVNLEPKMLHGLESQGMILAADNEGYPVLLHPEKEITSGSRVR